MDMPPRALRDILDHQQPVAFIRGPRKWQVRSARSFAEAVANIELKWSGVCSFNDKRNLAHATVSGHVLRFNQQRGTKSATSMLGEDRDCHEIPSSRGECL